MTAGHAQGQVCAACPVLQGECPICGTFWIVDGGKRHGLMPVQRQAFDGPTNRLFTRNQLGNFIERPVTTADADAVKQRLVAAWADYMGYAESVMPVPMIPAKTQSDGSAFVNALDLHKERIRRLQEMLCECPHREFFQADLHDELCPVYLVAHEPVSATTRASGATEKGPRA